MNFDENMLRSVIEEVLKEMGSASTAPAAKAAPAASTLSAGEMTLADTGEAAKGVARRLIGLEERLTASIRQYL